ncbi:MAG: HD domain-containing protein, partial [Clostridia bacterium]|nr:HD domain-containing protein [Clostridia bacterium]
YLDLTLGDQTGEINGKVWDVNDDMVTQYTAGSVVKAKGTVTSWQNNLQLKVIRVRVATDTDEINYDTLIQSAPLKPEDMYAYIQSMVEAMENEEIKKLVKFLVEEKEEKFLTHPAAKRNHHAIRSGLIYHVYRMLKSGQALSGVYTNINTDLLYAGIILHDLEKINEMDADRLGIVSDYTKEGQLLGHIIMGIKRIDEAAKQLEVSDEVSQLLQHMVLTHHYEPEYGSPKKPMMPEGELLHYIDMIDARMYDMDKALDTVGAGEFSEPVFVLDRRRIYKANL